MPYDVKLVGIAGASGSGKSSLSRRLATRLGSPVIPIQQDWFFRESVPAGVSYESIGAVDMEAFAAALHALLVVAREGPPMCCRFAADGPASPAETRNDDEASTEDESPRCAACALEYPPKPKRKGIDVHRPGSRAYAGEAATAVVWIVVEGFLLFVDEAFAQRFDVRICIDAPLEKCRLRRFLRENEVDLVIDHAGRDGATHVDAEDDRRCARYALSNDWAVVKTTERDPAKMAMLPEYTGRFCDWYAAEVAPWFHQYWPVQLAHAAAGSNPVVLGCSGDTTESPIRLPACVVVDNSHDDAAHVPRLAAELAAVLSLARRAV